MFQIHSVERRIMSQSCPFCSIYNFYTSTNIAGFSTDSNSLICIEIKIFWSELGNFGRNKWIFHFKSLVLLVNLLLRRFQSDLTEFLQKKSWGKIWKITILCIYRNFHYFSSYISRGAQKLRNEGPLRSRRRNSCACLA